MQLNMQFDMQFDMQFCMQFHLQKRMDGIPPEKSFQPLQMPLNLCAFVPLW